MIHRETRDEKDKEDPPVESRGSEWTPMLSKLLLREVWLDPGLVNDLCLMDYICKVYVIVH